MEETTYTREELAKKIRVYANMLRDSAKGLYYAEEDEDIQNEYIDDIRRRCSTLVELVSRLE